MLDDIKIYSKIPAYSSCKLEEQFNNIFKFLNLVYPFLENDKWSEGCIELRPLNRSGNYEYVRSYNTWRLLEKDSDKLRKFLAFLNGKPYCLYYSGFAFDYSQNVLRSDGKEYLKGKINSQNSIYTYILPMDFDRIEYHEFLQQKQKFQSLSIETLDIFTGHGFQSLILLRQASHDKDTYKKFTTLLLSKGFKVDPCIVDSARVLRLPNTLNCKAFDKNSSYYSVVNPEIIETMVVNWTKNRYEIEEVFEKINQLPTKNHIPIQSKFDLNISTHKAQKPISIQKNIDYASLYHFIDYKSLPDPIKKMLMGSMEGFRNKVILFLIPFLRNSLGLNKENISNLMRIWGKLCKPRLDETFINSEVNRIYSLNFKGNYGRYDLELVKEYGAIEFNIFKKDNKVIVTNEIFQDFASLTDTSIKLYIAMKLQEKLNGCKNFNMIEICEFCSISVSTFKRALPVLTSTGYVTKKKTNRRKCNNYEYYINPFFSTTKGFTTISNATVSKMLLELTNGEIKLYSYLSFIAGHNKTSIIISQKELARKIGKSQAAISMMTDQLTNKGFIRKETIKRDVLHSSYYLVY